MTTASITAGTNSKLRLRGFALISVITALMLTLLLEALDQTIVGTAMPRIIEELHGLDRYSWVVTAYILASMTMIPMVGKLSDQFEQCVVGLNWVKHYINDPFFQYMFREFNVT